MKKEQSLLSNNQIPFNEFLLIDEAGVSLGIVLKSKALAMAEEKMVDIYLLPNTSNPPVVKFGKLSKILYEQEKKIHKLKKTVKTVIVKTITLSIRISHHDLGIKLEKGKKFLLAGDKLEVAMRLRKKEVTEANILKAKTIFENNIVPLLSEYGQIEKPLSVNGMFIKIMFTALKKAKIS